MNKTQYLEELRKYLKRVPQQDLEDALEYYKEYFEEAGEENEQKIIDELGAPKELARRIIIECVDKSFSEETEDSLVVSADMASDSETSGQSSNETKKEKKGVSPWLVLLAVFALPLSPIAFALIVVALAIVISIIAALIAWIAGFGALAIAGVATAVLGVVALFGSPTGGLLTIGGGLVCAAIGCIFFALAFTLVDLIIKAMSKAGRKYVHKKAGKKS